MDKKFFQELRKELEDKKKIAKDLKDAIDFGVETGNVDPNAKAELAAAQASIKQFDNALKKRGY